MLPSELAGFDARALEETDDVVCQIDESFVIRWVNPAWSRFAAANGGEPAISARWSVGSSLLRAITGPQHAFYRDQLRRCMAQGARWTHDYECSSPEKQRLLHLTAYPLKGRGLLMVHSLVRSTAHEATGWQGPAILDDYRDVQGRITQCGHCRRFRHPGDHERWDWIPEWVAQVPLQTSHGLCATCLDHYYPG